YASFIQNLSVNVNDIHSLTDIPFLPISFFKSHPIQSGTWTPETWFRSSGTTGAQTSAHPVADVLFYHENARLCFEYAFGPISDFHFFALLPSYLERKDSSLISM